MSSWALPAFRRSTPSGRSSKTTLSPLVRPSTRRTSAGMVSWPFEETLALLTAFLLTSVIR